MLYVPTDSIPDEKSVLRDIGSTIGPTKVFITTYIGRRSKC